MTRIFLSYRRDDEPGLVRALLTKIDAAELGAAFLDLEGIPAGEDFRKVLGPRVTNCEALLVMVGPRWMDELKSRHGAPKPDYVVFEIQLALMLGKRIIPVLLRGAKPPAAEELPDSIRDLSNLQAVSLHDDSFDADCGHLLASLGFDGDRVIHGAHFAHCEHLIRSIVNARSAAL